MGTACTRLRRPPDGTIPVVVESPDGHPLEVAGAPTVTTYQNNDGSYVLAASHTDVLAVPPSYSPSPIRMGENTNNQFLSADILGAQSKVVPPQPPSYSPSPPQVYPPVFSPGSVTTTTTVVTPVGGSINWNIPSGPSTQDFYARQMKVW